MELRHVRYFLAVAEERNFTRAAARVGIGQPPLSQQIRALETEIGSPLFRRLPHGVDLTEAGEAFLIEARKLLAQADQAMRNARRAAAGESGQLRVGFTSSASFHTIVAASIRAYSARYPEVEITLIESPTTELLERLWNGDLDAVFIRPGRSDPDGIHVRRIMDESTVIIVPANHAHAGAASLELAALEQDAFLLFPRHAGPELFDEIVAACRRSGFEPSIGQTAPEITSIASFVAAGLGVSVIPVSLAAQHVPGVSYVPIAGEAPVAPLALATRPNESSAVVKNYVALVAAQLTSSRPHRVKG